MKSRLETYRSKRWKQKLKYSVLSSVVILPSLYFTSGLLSSTPGTFAWFSSETSGSGSIQNVTTSDLLRITAGKVVYEKNCKVSNSLSITNISQLDTTVFVGLGSHSVSKRLQPGKSFSVDFDIDYFEKNGNATSIHYRIKAFNNYVNETFSVAIDQDKLKATAKDKEKDENPHNASTKDDSNQAKTETQNNKSPQENQNNASETTPNDKNNADGTTKTDGNSGNSTPAVTPPPNQNEETQNENSK
jgi:hypothetical protein